MYRLQVSLIKTVQYQCERILKWIIKNHFTTEKQKQYYE